MEDVSKYKVEQLKSALKLRDLDIKGRKSDLLKRLVEAIADEDKASLKRQRDEEGVQEEEEPVKKTKLDDPSVALKAEPCEQDEHAVAETDFAVHSKIHSATGTKRPCDLEDDAEDWTQKQSKIHKENKDVPKEISEEDHTLKQNEINEENKEMPEEGNEEDQIQKQNKIDEEDKEVSEADSDDDEFQFFVRDNSVALAEVIEEEEAEPDDKIEEVIVDDPEEELIEESKFKFSNAKANKYPALPGRAGEVTQFNYVAHANELGKRNTPFEVDLDAMTDDEKPWNRYQASLDDFFNYGFNEASWRVYAARQVALRIHAIDSARANGEASNL